MYFQYTQHVFLGWLVGFSLMSLTGSVSIRSPMTSVSPNADTTQLAPNSTSIVSSPDTPSSSPGVSVTSTERSQHGLMTDQTSDEPHTVSTDKQRIASSSSSSPASTEGSTEDSFLWKGVSIGIGSLCVLVLLAFIVTIASLCRLRGQLIRMRTMLYPRDEEHVYDKLRSLTDKIKAEENGNITKSGSSNKKSVKVELKPLQVRVEKETLDDEEIHSPMSPEPPPISSLISPKNTIQNRLTSRNNSAHDTAKPVCSDTNTFTNEAFDKKEKCEPINNVYTNDENDTTGGNKDEKKAEFTGLYDEDADDDNLYETYTFSPTHSKQKDIAQVKRSKSSPVIAHKTYEVKRQKSLSGLPDNEIRRVNSQIGVDGIPLQDIDEDFTAHFDSGIPMVKMSNDEQLHMSEGQSFENTQCEYEPIEDDPINMPVNNQTENVGPTQNEQKTPFGEVDRSNIESVLKPSNSVGFDLLSQNSIIPNGQLCDENVYDNDNEDGLFNPFDEYMVPVTGTPKVPDTNMMAVDNRRAEDIVSKEMFTTEVDYEDVDGVPLRDDANKLNIFKTSWDSIPDGLSKLDPLEMLKTEKLRLRTDSSSTPDNYYLDLNEELQELKVEESKRISSQFPSEFYIRNLGSVEKLSNSDDNFVNMFEGNLTIDTGTDGKTSSEFQNEGPLYQNLVFRDDTEVFGNESTT